MEEGNEIILKTASCVRDRSEKPGEDFVRLLVPAL
jgi:hypothetical protein